MDSLKRKDQPWVWLAPTDGLVAWKELKRERRKKSHFCFFRGSMLPHGLGHHLLASRTFQHRPLSIPVKSLQLFIQCFAFLMWTRTGLCSSSRPSLFEFFASLVHSHFACFPPADPTGGHGKSILLILIYLYIFH